MNQFIESLCRLYKENKISNKTLDKLLEDGKIKKQEYLYIVSAKNEK